uniref:Uncharacterized protein MANES_09G069400 n=1 Tax=Rhizophora mucronata TaxID=61149 RepID=A0A2P2M0V1_RHIMU
MIGCSGVYRRERRHHVQHDQRYDFTVIIIGDRAIARLKDLFQNPRGKIQAPVREDSPFWPPSLCPRQERYSGTLIAFLFLDGCFINAYFDHSIFRSFVLGFSSFILLILLRSGSVSNNSKSRSLCVSWC